jgi:ABC-2 type transport system ATP-binding protein
VITNLNAMHPAPNLGRLHASGVKVVEPFRPGAPAIEVANLTKSYGEVAAVAGVDLEIQVGEIFALLGPNGAGKTTTVEILEGYRHRDGGEVSVLGCDPERDRKQLKPRIGIVLQSTGIDRYLTVTETIEMYASYYPHPRPVGEVVELVGLDGKRDTRVLKLSGGQQRRLDVAIALAGDPDLLFLDEPTTGFDPSARREAWEVVKNLATLGKTVLLTTHYMDEAQYLADRVAVMAAGRIVATGTPEQLGDRHTEGVRIRFRLPGNTALPADLQGRPAAQGCVELVPDDLSRTLHRLTGWAIERGIELEQLEIVRKSLEDVYLELTGDPAAAESVPPETPPTGRRQR